MSYPKYRAAGIIVGGDWDALTRTVLNYGGATAVVGFNANLTGRENYFLCDGTADDVQINEALVYVNGLGGGTVLLERGTFDIASVVQMRNNTTLVGVGRDTILRAADGLDDSVIENLTHDTGNHDFTIRNLQIDGNKANQTDILDVVNGINLDYSYDWLIKDVWIHDVKEQSIRIGAGCYNGLITNFDIRDGDWTGLGITYFNHAVVLGDRPYKIKAIVGYVENCREFALDYEGTDWCEAHAISCLDCDTGYQLFQSEQGLFRNLRATDCHKWGIRSYTSPQCTIEGCVVDEWDTDLAGNIDAIYIESDRNLISGNHTFGAQGRYSLNIAAGQWNKVGDNWLAGWPMQAFNDSGVDTQLRVASYQFTEPIVGTISTSSPTGVDVDVDTEQAVAWGQLPEQLQEVARIKIWAVATAGPIGAGGQMHLEIVFNAGASNVAYNEAAKSWTIANHDSEEADYVADDVVHWVIENADIGNELWNLAAGDSFEIFAIHEAGADPDGATDAVFRVVEVEYV